jgi:hypothetical protein
MRWCGEVGLACAVLAWATLVGCGDGGPTRGSQCTQVLDAACDRIGRVCMEFPTNQIPDCVSAGVSTCCNGNCSASVVSTQADIDLCIADMETASCASLDVLNGGTLPASCMGVVRSSLTSTPAHTQHVGGSAPERLGALVSE